MSLVRELSLRVLSAERALEICRELERLGARLRTIGRSAGGRPIVALELGEGRLRLMAVCRIHGNEPAPSNAALLFAYLLLTRGRVFALDLRGLLRRLKVILVPVANPDGADEYYAGFCRNPRPSWDNAISGARLNAAGVDLNRDWIELTQPETRCLHELFNEVRPHVVLDMHEFYFKGGYPPKWPDGEGEFMITLTDTPYFGVLDPIRTLSERLLEVVSNAIKEEGWSHWPLRPRWYLGDAKGGDLVVSPIFLGSHVPYEGSAKLLVETWGVGLGEYLMYDRVHIHLAALAHVALWMVENEEYVLAQHKAALSLGRELASGMPSFVVEGAEIDRAAQLLSLHGIKFERDARRGRLVVDPRRSPDRVRMIEILLDPESEISRRLLARKKMFTLDRLFDVVLRRA